MTRFVRRVLLPVSAALLLASAPSAHAERSAPARARDDHRQGALPPGSLPHVVQTPAPRSARNPAADAARSLAAALATGAWTRQSERGLETLAFVARLGRFVAGTQRTSGGSVEFGVTMGSYNLRDGRLHLAGDGSPCAPQLSGAFALVVADDRLELRGPAGTVVYQRTKAFTGRPANSTLGCFEGQAFVPYAGPALAVGDLPPR